jgi:large subunit ribosomal protein L24
MAFRIRKGDLVQVVGGVGRSSGKQGRVLAVDRKAERVRVEGVRLQKRHVKPGRKASKTGGIVEKEGFIDLSNVMLVDPSSGKPSRVRIRHQGERRARVFAKGGATVPEPSAR